MTLTLPQRLARMTTRELYDFDAWLLAQRESCRLEGREDDARGIEAFRQVIDARLRPPALTLTPPTPQTPNPNDG